MGRAAGSWWRALAFDLGLFPLLRRHNAFAAADLEGLARAVLTSGHLGQGAASQAFSGSRGFSITFNTDGIARVRSEFPAFGPYLDGVLDPRCDAFFLNALVITDGDGKTARVDRSLRSVTFPVEPPNPSRVSVLYLAVPVGLKGGLLGISDRFIPLAAVRPRANLLVEFQGFLRHGESATKASDPAGSGRQPLVALVCEQYQLPRALLERIPEYSVRSMSDFDAFLEAEMDRGDDDDPVIVWAEPVDRDALPSEVVEAPNDETTAGDEGVATADEGHGAKGAPAVEEGPPAKALDRATGAPAVEEGPPAKALDRAKGAPAVEEGPPAGLDGPTDQARQ